MGVVNISATFPGNTGNTNDPTTPASTKATTTTLKGVDVSRWQKEVNWPLVKESEITFAFVKATQADFRLDPYFDTNWSETKRVGIKRGAYHFFIPEAPIEGQIDMFINTVRLEPGDLPPVLDIEVWDKNVSAEALRQKMHTWLQAVEQHYGIKPIIYTNQNYYRRWLKGHFQDYHFWIARYSPVEPETHHTDKWMFWQYTDSGRISGIKSAVDMNFFVGDMETLAGMCVPEPSEPYINPLAQLKHKHPLP
ncbi:glycoside hydrolase family 25 protein [Pontibacter harenae]|uniref:glycoside hydrolase family 25 protein n=1 Tax=Pontibacter harenae TaxID=2894083 RepID=UPI001E4C8EA1|nr:lysozyme [Pontibacter harenae]